MPPGFNLGMLIPLCTGNHHYLIEHFLPKAFTPKSMHKVCQLVEFLFIILRFWPSIPDANSVLSINDQGEDMT